MLRSKVVLLALAVTLFGGASRAHAQPRFQRVGTQLYKDGAPFRAVGVNKFDVGTEFQGLSPNRSRELGVDLSVKAFGDMADRGAPFVRFSSWGFGKEDFQAYQSDPQTWAAHFTELCDRAGQNGVFLIPTLCWNIHALSDLTGEPIGSIVRDPNSQGWQALRDFTRDIVTRFKDRPEILMWELTNELNLEADLDLTARGGKPGDDFSTDDMIGFVRRFAQEIRAIDATRPIDAGYASPRTAAAHLRRSPEFSGHADWTNDSAAERQGYVRDTNPDPIDVISMHAYDAEVNNIGDYKRCADLAGKPLYVGEFASSNPLVTVDANGAAAVFQAFVGQFEAQGVPLASVWDFCFFQFDPSERDPFGLIPNVNEDQFAALRAANERSGAVAPLAATPTAPRALVSRPADGSTINAGTNVSVYVHASDRSAISSVELFVDGQSAGATATYPFTIAWTPSAGGAHVLVARVTNSAGLTTDSKPVHVTVPGGAPAAQPPTIFSLDGTGTGVPIGWFQRHAADGSLVGYESLYAFDFTQGRFAAVPVDLGSGAGEKVYACLYAKDATGGTLTATVGGVPANVVAAPSVYPGVDQVNVELPSSVGGRGSVDVVLIKDGASSKAVTLAIK